MYEPPRVKAERREVNVEDEDDDNWQDYDDWEHPLMEEQVPALQPVVVLKKLGQDELSSWEGRSKRRPHECGECGARFSSHDALVGHTRRHARANPFTCPYCPGVFRFQTGLLHHQCSQDDFQAPVLQAPITQAPVVHAPVVQSPVEKPSSDEKHVKCPLCVRRFREPRTLRIHMTMKHSKKEVLSCRLCEEKLDSMSSLLLHAAEHAVQGSDGGVFRCAVCPAEFLTRFSLRSHMRVHTTGNPHGCKKCPQRFTSRAALWAHLRMHGSKGSEQKFVCSQCEQSFIGRRNLFFHIKSVHRAAAALEAAKQTEESVVAPAPVLAPVAGPRRSKKFCRKISFTKPFKCWGCPRTFGTAKSLHNHRKYRCVKTTLAAATLPVKRYGKWFKCSKCDVRVKTRKKLWWHWQTHRLKTEDAVNPATVEDQTNVTADACDKEYLCSKCPEVFPDRRSHLCHIKTDHANEPRSDSVKGYNCGKCSESFRDRKAHFAHYKTFHSNSFEANVEEVLYDCDASDTKPKGFRCSKCPRTFPDRKSHWAHYKLHNSSEPVSEAYHSDEGLDPVGDGSAKATEYHHCSKCTEIFPDRRSHSLHYRTTHGSEPQEEVDEKSREYHCSKCTEVFPDRKAHLAHYKAHHPDQSDGVCEDATDPKPGTVKGKLYHCSKCPEVFPDKRAHIAHYKAVHTTHSQSVEKSDSMYEDSLEDKSEVRGKVHCSKCPEVFSDRKSHRWHYRIHIDADNASEGGEEMAEGMSIKLKEYHCSKCSEVFSDRKAHFAHYRSAHSDSASLEDIETEAQKPKQFNCRKCFKVFPDRKQHWLHYREHMEMVEVDPVPDETGLKKRATRCKSFRCSKCTKRFANRRVLWFHIQHHKSNSNAMLKAYKCNKCTEWFSLKESLREHMKAAHNSTEGVTTTWKCSKCLAHFGSRTQLWAHVKTHRVPAKKTYKCDSCEEQFSARGDLRAHAEVHRSGPANPGNALYDLPAQQPACATETPRVKAEPTDTGDAEAEPSTKDSDLVLPHTITVELRPEREEFDQPTEEEEDPLAFQGNGQDQSIEPLPPGVGDAPPSPDDVAEASVKTNKELDGADTIVNGHPVESNTDSKEGDGTTRTAFSKKREAHRQVAAKLKLRFKCKKCDARFSNYLGFNAHQRVHALVKPYKCKQCEACFTNGPNLLRHMKNHLGIKPFKCRQCGESFSTSKARKKHVMDVHPPAVIEG